MHLSSVFHILGRLLMFLGIAMILPVPFSLHYGGGDHPAFLISAAVTLVAGFVIYRSTRFAQDLRPREGFAVVTFAWTLLSLFGCLPFLISGAIPSFTDAFFETMSGFTTTGASILTDIEGKPHGILFWRSLTHWFGGMGIIVLSLAILPFLGIGGMQLFKAEVPGPVKDKLTPRITETAKILWGVYVLISAVEVLLLRLGGMSLFDSLCHTFGTMATGGFSTRNASIAAYDSAYIDYVIIVFMIIAGTNFALHFRLLRGEIGAYIRNREFLFYLAVLAAGFLVIGVEVYFRHYHDFSLTVRKGLFQVVSIITTTGYVTEDYEQWSFGAQYVLFVLMFVGGCAGSTGGGIKVARILVLMKAVFAEIMHLLHPHSVRPVRIGDTPIPREIVSNVVGFFITFILLFVVGVLVMSALGLDMATSFGCVAATINNIGPGLGDVGPVDHYAHIPVAGKWVLSFLMLVGRLEVFTVIVLFSPSYWQK